jgi:hypothetical protein
MTFVELSERLSAAGRPIPVLGLRRIERGERRVDVDDLVALAVVFGVSPERLLRPFDCPKYHGEPPVGFTCNTCGQVSSFPVTEAEYHEARARMYTAQADLVKRTLGT